MKERIKQIRLKLGMQQGEFAKSLNIIQQQLSKYERGENKPSSEFFILLANKFNVNINWLLTGKGEIFNSGHNLTQNSVKILPYYGNDELKSMIFDADLVHNIWKKDENDLRLIRIENCTKCDDNSNNFISRGDILLIDISVKDFDFGFFVYRSENDKKIFADFVRPLPGGGVQFVSDSKYYAPVSYSKDELKSLNINVLGKVIKNISYNLNY